MLKQALIKISFIGFVSILFVGILVFIIIANKSNYIFNINNETKNLNTSLLNNVYIIHEEKSEEVITEKVSSITNTQVKKIETKNNNQVEPTSTIVEEDTKPVEEKKT